MRSDWYDPQNPPRHQGLGVTPYGRASPQVLNWLWADTTGWSSNTARCWVPTSPLGYVSILGETGVGLEGGVGCNPRVTFDGKVRDLGPRTFCLRPQIRFPPTWGPPSQHPLDRRQSPPPLQTRRSGGSVSILEWAPVSTGDRSGVGGSSNSHDQQSRIVLRGEGSWAALTLVSLSDAPCLNRRCPGSLYSIVEYE